jgi:hypothetical protein
VEADAAHRGQHQQRREQEAAESEHAGEEKGILTPQHPEEEDRHGDE